LIEHLGDIVAAEPITRYARRKFPDASIVWFVRKPYRELVEAFPEVDLVVAVGCLTEWILLRGTTLIDHVLDLHLNRRICGTCQIELLKDEAREEITADNYYRFGNLLAVECQNAGIPVVTGAPILRIPEGVKRSIDALSLPKIFVVFHCLSNQHCRDWEQSKWLQLADEIEHRYAMTVVEVGLKPMLSSGPARTILDLCGKLSISETAEVIRRATALIGIDSGPAHLANAMGTYGIIILGRYMNFERYMPYNGNYENEQRAALLWADGPARLMGVDRVLDALERRLRDLSRSYATGQ
jgi:ADP-heptose:LPS heptosyltransferase